MALIDLFVLASTFLVSRIKTMVTVRYSKLSYGIYIYIYITSQKMILVDNVPNNVDSYSSLHTNSRYGNFSVISKCIKQYCTFIEREY